MFAPFRALLSIAGRVFAERADLLLENLELRHQLAIYKRQETRPRFREQDRFFWTLLSRLWPRWRHALVIVQPDTVVRWHHRTWRRYWLWGPKTPSVSESAPWKA